MPKVKKISTPKPDLQRKVTNSLLIASEDDEKVFFDFSFPGAFYSTEVRSFNNYCLNKDDFLEKFRHCMGVVSDISGFTINQIRQEGKFHYHPVSKNKIELVSAVVKKLCDNPLLSTDYYTQHIEANTIHQIGKDKGIRFIGTVFQNRFKVYFIDYFHDIEFNQTKNERNKKYCKFCAMTSSLE